MAGAATILVAGKSGQLAQSLLELAADDRNLRIVAAGRPELDIEQPASIEQVVSSVAPAVIINAAAYTAVDKAELEPERCFAVNCNAAAQLAAAAWRLRVPFIHISSDYVFDGEKPTPYVEDDATAPLGVYGQSKLEGERAVLSAHPLAVTLRTSWVYSAFGSNFVKTMLQLAKSQPLVRVVDDQQGCPTSAHDLAVALLRIASELVAGPSDVSAGLYHLSGSGRTTWHALAAEVFARAKARGWPVPQLEAIATADYPTRARRPRNSSLDCAKINRAFGVALPPWSASVRMCVDRLMSKELQQC